MDAQSPHSLEKVEENEPVESTNGRCCCLLLLLMFLLLGLAVVLCTTSILVLRPKKPVFSLHAIQLESLKLNVTKSKGVQLPPSTASLSFVTRNPNKIGILYSSTELGVLYGGIPVGVVRVPLFYQPPRSENISLVMHANTFEQLNLTGLITGGLHSNSSSSSGSRIAIRIIGSIGAHLNLMNFSLPTIKIALDCQISMDYSGVALLKGISYIKMHKALLLSSFPHVSHKCYFSPYL